MFREIPVLPVVVPLGVAAYAVLISRLRRRHLLSAPRALVALLLCVYLAGVIANTIFPIFLDMPASSRPWSAGLAVVPLADYEIADAAMNGLVFVPLGCLIPIVFGASSAVRVVAVAAAASLAIEATQFATGRLLNGGHIADVNDLIFNVTGAAVGFALLQALSRIPRIAAAVDRLRWRNTAAPRESPR